MDGLSCICTVQEFLKCAYNGTEINEETINILYNMPKEDLLSYIYFMVTQLKLKEEIIVEEKKRIVSMEEKNLEMMENYFINNENQKIKKI